MLFSSRMTTDQLLAYTDCKLSVPITMFVLLVSSTVVVQRYRSRGMVATYLLTVSDVGKIHMPWKLAVQLLKT